MNILSIDTSNQVCSVSVITPKDYSSIHLEAKNSQSGIVIEEINTLLEKHDLPLQQIDYIIYGAGPGSFTGVRLSLSIATGLSITNNIKNIGISSTLSMAYEAFLKYEQSSISIIQDARKSELFFAEYTISNDDIRIITKDKLLLPSEITLAQSSQAIAGSAVNILEPASNQCKVLDIVTPNAYYQGMLAKRLIEQNIIDIFNMSSPNYVRNDVTG